MKRFWTKADVIESAGKFTIVLDGKPVRQSGGLPLLVPFAALAEGIAQEWAKAREQFSLDDFPLTRLTASAQGQDPATRSQIIDQLARYGMNDLLCYRSEGPSALAAREAAEWDPWIRWAAGELGAVLHCTTDILPIEQPAETHAAFRLELNRKSNYALTGLAVIIPALGSLVLGLAVERGALEPKSACACANLGALWQAARWGNDADAAASRASAEYKVALAERFIRLCRT